MSSPWRCLEEVPTLSAVAAEWRQHSGAAFDAFKEGFLQKAGRDAKSFPCPNKPGCSHKVHPRGRGFVGVCKDDEGTGCDDILLTKEDVEVWEVNFLRLGRAVAKALKCDGKEAGFGLERTQQIASLGSAPLPVVLTIQQDDDGFSNVVAQLVARLPKGFILPVRSIAGYCLFMSGGASRHPAGVSLGAPDLRPVSAVCGRRNAAKRSA